MSVSPSRVLPGFGLSLGYTLFYLSLMVLVPLGACFGTDGTGQVYSFHPGGVNALFGDASVRYLQQTIDIATFAALVTIADGETVAVP